MEDPKPITDSERLDALERIVRDTPLLIWDGLGSFPAPGRSLRGIALTEGDLRTSLDWVIRREKGD